MGVSVVCCSSCDSAPPGRDANTTSDASSDAALDGYALDAQSDVRLCDAAVPDIQFLPVPHGTFTMGSPVTEPGRGKFSETQVQVTLTHDIEMSRTETTQAQWTALCFDNPSGTVTTLGVNGGDFSDGIGAEYPVGGISYWDALSYANALSAIKGYPPCYIISDCEGRVGGGPRALNCRHVELTAPSTYDCSGYRLPTDAEYEYADRAGTTTATYAGDVLDRPDAGTTCYPDPDIDTIGWCCGQAIPHTQPVAQKKPNGWGLFDMIGNAWEWVDGDFNGLGYGPGPLTNPFGSVSVHVTNLGFDDPNGIWRGGQISMFNMACRSAARQGEPRVATPNQPYVAGPAEGFRLVRTVK